MRNPIAVTLCALTLTAQIASGAFAADERYQMMQLSDGTVRLNSHTGAVSYCRETAGGLACSMAAEERDAWVATTHDLSQRVAELETRIAKLEAGAPSSDSLEKNETPARPNNEAGPELSGNEEKQIDKAMKVAESLMKRFARLVKELRNDVQGL